MVKFNEDAIKIAAYYNWQNAGCPQGKDEYFWAMAVEQLNKCCCNKSAKKPAAKAKTSSAAKVSSVAKTVASSAKKKTTIAKK